MSLCLWNKHLNCLQGFVGCPLLTRRMKMRVLHLDRRCLVTAACCNVVQSLSGGSWESCWELFKFQRSVHIHLWFCVQTGSDSWCEWRHSVAAETLTAVLCQSLALKLLIDAVFSTGGLLNMDAASRWMLASRAAVTWQRSRPFAGFSTRCVWAYEAFLWLSLPFCFFRQSFNWKHEGHNTLKPLFVAGNHPSGPRSLISQRVAIWLSSFWSVERHPEIMRIIRSSLSEEDNFSAGCTK